MCVCYTFYVKENYGRHYVYTNMAFLKQGQVRIAGDLGWCRRRHRQGKKRCLTDQLQEMPVCNDHCSVFIVFLCIDYKDR